MLSEEEQDKNGDEQEEQLGLWRAADRGHLDRVRQLVEQVVYTYNSAAK
jgi:hypothetical protein